MRMTLAEVLAHQARVASATHRNLDVPASADAVEDESELHAQIIAHCRKQGWLFFHGSMAHKSRRTLGEPDFTILPGNGRILLIECKSARGKRSPAQLAVAAHAAKQGVTIPVVSSMADFLALLP